MPTFFEHCMGVVVELVDYEGKFIVALFADLTDLRFPSGKFGAGLTWVNALEACWTQSSDYLEESSYIPRTM